MADPLFSSEEEAAMRADAAGLPSERREPVEGEVDEVVDQSLDQARTASPADDPAAATNGPAGDASETGAEPEGGEGATSPPESDKGKRIAALVEAVRSQGDEPEDDVVPFQEDGAAALSGAAEAGGVESDAAGVEELDIEDAEEVVHEAPRPALLQPPMPAAPADWFEQVFDDDYLRILPPVHGEYLNKEIEFVLEHLAAPQGSRLLDLGCGHGMVATSLQARGFDVVGLDSSMIMLTVATEEARRRGLGPGFVHGDMRALQLDSEFDGVLCIHGTFGYFEEEQNEKILASVFRALKPGGRFVIGLPNRDYFVSDLPARVCWEAHGNMVLDEVDFDFLLSRLEVRRSIALDDGRQVEHRYSVRAYSMHEITRLLEKAGFHVTSVSGSIATPGTFLGPYSRALWVFAQKT